MAEATTDSKVKVLVYSDDRTVRQQVRLALGKRVAADLPEIEVFETATEPAVITAMDTERFDLVILDAEAVPSGGMGIAYRLRDEFSPCPPVLLLVARVADAWLASWSKADAVAVHPIDPVQLPRLAAELLRAGATA